MKKKTIEFNKSEIISDIKGWMLYIITINKCSVFFPTAERSQTIHLNKVENIIKIISIVSESDGEIYCKLDNLIFGNMLTKTQ